MSDIDEVYETSSAEQANQMRKRGWVMLAIGKGHDENGEPCLKYSLGWKHPGPRPLGPQASRQDTFIPDLLRTTLAK